MSKHLVVIGDCRNMAEVDDGSVQLIVTSPPYFNVKDYGVDNIGSIQEYGTYLKAMRQVFSECYRVLEDGRYCCINVSDVISGDVKYPIPCHYVGIIQRAGFSYRDDIVWKKPSGVGAKSVGGSGKRFGTLIQNPFPMYYYPNNVYEHILIFRKGKFDFKAVSDGERENARLDVEEAKRRWSNDVWEMVPEIKNKYNKDTHPAMFPEELPEAFIRLYTYPGETVLDPFLGSGTTTKVAQALERNSIGYEINLSYLLTIEEKTGFQGADSDFRVIIRQDGDKYED